MSNDPKLPKPEEEAKDKAGISSFLGTPASITWYFIIIILLSLFGFFALFPNHGLVVTPEEIAIKDLSTQDTIVQINGNLKSTIVNDQATDSLTLKLNVDRRIFKDTVAMDNTVVSSEHSVSFSAGKFPDHEIMWLIIIVGILGASIHALTSLSEYVGNNTYDSKWSLWYYLRPFVGALLALISYLLVRAGLFPVETTSDLYGILAVAGIIGMFSKQALYKISDIANAIFTTHHEEKLKDKLSENPVPKVNSAPLTIAMGATDRTLTLAGENFVNNTKVYHKEEELPIVIKSSTELEVTLSEESIKEAGDLLLKIVNPPPNGGEVMKTVVVTPPEDGGSTETDTGTKSEDTPP